MLSIFGSLRRRIQERILENLLDVMLNWLKTDAAWSLVNNRVEMTLSGLMVN